MSEYSQRGRRIAVHTPLGEDVLLLAGFECEEGLSQLFHLRLELYSTHDDIDASQIVGRPVDVMMRLLEGGDPDGGGTRWFNGHVIRFVRCGRDDRLTRYTAEVAPWTWFLGRRTDCRIFQAKTVVQIVQEVFASAGFDRFELKGLRSQYPSREYCVQYRESDLAFVSRLLEEEGIFYWFRHEQGRHTLVLGDGPEAYGQCQEGSVSFRHNLSGPALSDDLTGWEHGYEFRSGKWSATDYNFKTPSTSLRGEQAAKGGLAESKKYELYDYPGEWEVGGEAARLARVRMEEELARHDVVRGGGKCRTFFPGGRFEIDRHHIAWEEGRAYVLTAMHHRVRADAPYTTGDAGRDLTEYENRFECIPAEVSFRPQRTTSKPFVRGVQTAVVVGPAGEELYVDEHARVKVQFHWDRRGKRDADSSCWIRVAQPWAGVGYGGLCIPRIGQEVIVDFLEGDPDRPIINGRVYNAETMPPVSNAGRDPSAGPAPEDITQAAMMTSLKSNSLGGSGGYNEITMNDTGGAEGLFVKAQKDNINQIGNDQTTTVGNNRDESIGVDLTQVVGNNTTETVGANQTTSIGANMTESVGANKAETVAMTSTETVGILKALTVGATYAVTVGAAHAVTVGAVMNTAVGVMQTEQVGVNKSTVVGSKYEIVVGSSKITLESSGKITIEGTEISIKSSGPVKVDGSVIDLN